MMKEVADFHSLLAELQESNDLVLFNCSLYRFHYMQPDDAFIDIYPDAENATYALCSRKLIDAISFLLVNDKAFFKPKNLSDVANIYMVIDQTATISTLDELLQFLKEDNVEIVKIK